MPPRPRKRRDTGQSSLEFAGIIAVAAIIIVAVLGVARTTELGKIATDAICKVVAAVGIGSCPGATGGEAPGEDGGGEQGGESNPQVDIPEGLDPESDLVRALLATERGRATLQWLADHDIPVVIDPDTTGAYWNGSEMVIGEGYDDPAVIVHETNHAQYTEEGRSANAQQLDREDYVNAAVAEEVDGTVQQIQSAQEFRDAGFTVGTAPGEGAYNEAYQGAIQNGSTPAQAEQAGYDAVLDLFMSGAIVTSTTGESYPDYYGGYWDSVN